MHRHIDPISRRLQLVPVQGDRGRVRAGPPLEEEALVRVLRVDGKAEHLTLQVWVGRDDVEALLRRCDVCSGDRPDDGAAKHIVLGVVFIPEAVFCRAYGSVLLGPLQHVELRCRVELQIVHPVRITQHHERSRS